MLESSYADVKNFQVYFDSDTNQGFKVLSLYCSGEENGLKNIVKRASWTYTVVDGQYSVRMYKDSYFGDPDLHSYTNYEDLTESQVIDWIKSTINLEEMENDLNQQLNQAKTPSIVKEKNLPWKYEDKYNISDMYVMVKDDVVVYGPVHWHSDLMNNYLEKNGASGNFPHDIVARQSGLLPIEKPLIVNENIKIYKAELQNEQPEESLYTLNGNIIWDFSSGIAIGTYVAIDKELDEVKKLLLQTVEINRNNKEISGLTVTLDNEEYKIFSGPISRLNLLEKHNLMQENDTCVWKFMDNKWATVNKTQVLYLYNSILDFVKNLQQWEHDKTVEINNATTVDQLKEISLEV